MKSTLFRIGGLCGAIAAALTVTIIVVALALRSFGDTTYWPILVLGSLVYYFPASLIAGALLGAASAAVSGQLSRLARFEPPTARNVTVLIALVSGTLLGLAPLRFGIGYLY